MVTTYINMRMQNFKFFIIKIQIDKCDDVIPCYMYHSAIEMYDVCSSYKLRFRLFGLLSVV